MQFSRRVPRGRRAVYCLVLSAAALGAASVALGGAAAGAPSNATPVWVSTQGKVVQLAITAGWNGTNSGFNFDGAANGQMTVTVPSGDTVDVTFTNKAQGAFHNVVVIPYTKVLPATSTVPAFPGSKSPARTFTPGAAPGAAAAPQKFSFVAGKAGTYLIVCGIAGHALAGMWDTFIVSPSATTASVAFGAARSLGAAATAAPPTSTAQLISMTGKVVHLQLIAALNMANDGFNFDGGAKGQMTVTVPLGATIIATFKNNSSTGHDVLIVPFQQPLPSHSVPTAFAGASSNKFTPGSGGTRRPPTGGRPPGGSGGFSNKPVTFTFTANKAGTYMIICGFPGHAIAGMWDNFVVSSTATTASISFK